MNTYSEVERPVVSKTICFAEVLCAGFSLLELLLVITLAGLLLALVLPSGQPAVVEQLRSTARLVTADLAYARSLTISNNSNYKIKFDLQNNRYVLEHSGANPALRTLPKSPFSAPDNSPTKHIVDLDELPRVGPLVRLATVVAGTPSQSVSEVEFGPLGQLTSGQTTTVWLSSGSGNQQRFIPIEINAVTGIARCGKCSLAMSPASAL